MPEIDQLLADQWSKAADDLSIRVSAPVDVSTPDGSTIRCEAHILDFATPRGAIVLSRTSAVAFFDAFPDEATRPWASIAYYLGATYDRAHFVETLDDWGWFGGEGEAPSWYTGTPWGA
jgi:hypothetical protein